MTPVRRIAFIGNSLPRRCGIATFTTDLQQAVATSPERPTTTIVAMTDHGHSYGYPPEVGIEIDDGAFDDYVRAAEFLNAGNFDVVSLQHEFGIFGGPAGSDVVALLSRLKVPVVTTLHTVLAEPTGEQRMVLDRIVEASARIVVMAEKGRALLRTVYGVADAKIEVIPHGIPDVAFSEPDEMKELLGFSGRTVILTFGLLSPNKGIEVMIDAMPQILTTCPDAVYVVLGATHPNLVRMEGEAYRQSLIDRAQALGIAGNVVFVDGFVAQDTLLSYIEMCDLYVTPYLSEAQMTSGTLAYSFGMGKAVVSTPYWHARELLTDGRGSLVPFGSSEATGSAIADLLANDSRRQAMRKRAYAGSRSMTWGRTAQRYLSVFADASAELRAAALARRSRGISPRDPSGLPEMRFDHLLSMCDDTGLFQHAVHSVPDRRHGYCVDDNARALLLTCALSAPGERALPDALASRFAAFVQYAWNPDTRRFRNFMSFDRRWLEDRGSEDSHGRTLWALGECARSDRMPSRRRWAQALFAESMGSVEAFAAPRSWAFTLLGLDGYLAARPGDAAALRLRDVLTQRLAAMLQSCAGADWVWFEDGLSYDNARLPQALIVSAHATGQAEHLAAGLGALRWLCSIQTNPAGEFRPVGSETFGEKRRPPRPFDQQALEAAATIAACVAARQAGSNDAWVGEARRAFAWFLGANDLALLLVDLETGSCRDGLHRDSANENRGAESVLSYLLALADIRKLARMETDAVAPVAIQAIRA